MKRLIPCLLTAMLLLSGCGVEEPYLVDEVVMIPMHPTEEPPPEVITEPETEPPTEVATEATEPAPAETIPAETVGKNPTSTKTSSKKTAASQKPSSSKTSPTTSKPKQTKPAETVPPTQAPTAAPTEVPAGAPATAPAEPPFDPASYIPGSLEYALLDALNTQRASAGVAELSLSTGLCGIAAIRAQEISRDWGHSRPDGRDFTSVLEDQGYSFTTAAESLLYAAASGKADAMAAKWMHSDADRANILSGDFTTAGIGICRMDGMCYVACIFTD